MPVRPPTDHGIGILVFAALKQCDVLLRHQSGICHYYEILQMETCYKVFHDRYHGKALILAVVEYNADVAAEDFPGMLNTYLLHICSAEIEYLLTAVSANPLTSPCTEYVRLFL